MIKHFTGDWLLSRSIMCGGVMVFCLVALAMPKGCAGWILLGMTQELHERSSANILYSVL